MTNYPTIVRRISGKMVYARYIRHVTTLTPPIGYANIDIFEMMDGTRIHCESPTVDRLAMPIEIEWRSKKSLARIQAMEWDEKNVIGRRVEVPGHHEGTILGADWTAKGNLLLHVRLDSDPDCQIGLHVHPAKNCVIGEPSMESDAVDARALMAD